MKRISIIGGGISGLAVLHFLKQRLGDNVDITLFEREAAVGGTIRSLKKDSSLFEWGPNGFLDNQLDTLQLIEDIGAADQLIESKTAAHRRYIQMNGNLPCCTQGPMDFIRTSLLPLKDKWSLITGIFKKNISKDRSIDDYVSQRFSRHLAETLVDPFISGIYAGDIKRLHMASAFPKLKRQGFKKPHMRSFKGGMGQIIESLGRRYKEHIQTNSEISSGEFNADAIIVATPAYAAARIVENLNPVLSQFLDELPYAPVAVTGLLFKQESFNKKPDGFGYLIPSSENKDILGVLIESNVYDGRAGEGQIMLRVMLGGTHHPGIINDDQERILAKAIREIDSVYGLTAGPVEIFFKSWPKAIPQYEINYPHWRQSIAEQCAKTPGLYLCGNYLDGVSFNDCIKNAKILAEAVNI